MSPVNIFLLFVKQNRFQQTMWPDVTASEWSHISVRQKAQCPVSCSMLNTLYAAGINAEIFLGLMGRLGFISLLILLWLCSVKASGVWWSRSLVGVQVQSRLLHMWQLWGLLVCMKPSVEFFVFHTRPAAFCTWGAMSRKQTFLQHLCKKCFELLCWISGFLLKEWFCTIINHKVHFFH